MFSALNFGLGGFSSFPNMLIWLPDFCYHNVSMEGMSHDGLSKGLEDFTWCTICQGAMNILQNSNKSTPPQGPLCDAGYVLCLHIRMLNTVSLNTVSLHDRCLLYRRYILILDLMLVPRKCNRDTCPLVTDMTVHVACIIL